MRVRAIRDHFDGIYRNAGDEFEIAGKPSEHVEKVKEAPVRKPDAETQGSDSSEQAAE